MYRSILVPLDGSPFAEQALPLAVSIANQAGASLEILRVQGHYSDQDPHASWAPYDPAAAAALKEQEQAYLDAIVKRLRTSGSAPVTSALVNGFAEDAILGRVQSKAADLIVMTTHGRGPMSRFWLGSVADTLVRHAPAPILLVRPQEGPEDFVTKPALRHVLIPLDGSELAERVLEPAIGLGSLMDAEYTLIHAVELSSLLDGYAIVAEPSAILQDRDARRAEAQAYLERVAEGWRTKGLRIHTHVVVGQSAVTVVLDMAREKNIDLIAIATHGRTGLKLLLLGSVADKIVRGTLTPVLVYRPMADGQNSQ